MQFSCLPCPFGSWSTPAGCIFVHHKTNTTNAFRNTHTCMHLHAHWAVSIGGSGCPAASCFCMQRFCMQRLVAPPVLHEGPPTAAAHMVRWYPPGGWTGTHPPPPPLFWYLWVLDRSTTYNKRAVHYTASSAARGNQRAAISVGTLIRHVWKSLWEEDVWIAADTSMHNGKQRTWGILCYLQKRLFTHEVY